MISEPWLVTLLLASFVLYVRGALALWRRFGRGRGITALNAMTFVLAWLAVGCALLPLDEPGERLFSLHMVQHVLLMAVAAPLLVVSRPLRAWAWALAPAWRRRASIFARSTWIRTPWQFITEPLAAWGLHGTAIWLWHAPTLFAAALENETVHVLQHLSLFGTALIFWWAVLSGKRRGSSSLISLFTTMLHTGALGALLVFSVTIWYPAYLATTAAAGLTPIEDQQLGGLLMWFPAGAVYLIAATVLGIRWLTRDTRATYEELLR